MYYHYLFALLGTAIEAASDITLKKYVTNRNYLYLIAGLLGYAISGYSFMKLLEYHDLVSSNIMWHVVHFMILAVVSIFYFKETYTYRDMLGILFGIVSFLLLATKHKH